MLALALSSITSARVLVEMPQVEPVTEFARNGFFQAIRVQLVSWLDFFSGAEWFSASAARAIAAKHLAGELAEPLKEFSSQLAEGGFVRLASWPLEPRRTMIAELQSRRRLEFLFSELNRYLADIPGHPERAPRIVRILVAVPCVNLATPLKLFCPCQVHHSRRPESRPGKMYPVGFQNVVDTFGGWVFIVDGTIVGVAKVIANPSVLPHFSRSLSTEARFPPAALYASEHYGD